MACTIARIKLTGYANGCASRGALSTKIHHLATWNLRRVDGVPTAVDVYPVAQLLHVDEPAAENVPARQVVHAPAPEAEAVPARQVEHDADPAVAYCPAVHVTHAPDW